MKLEDLNIGEKELVNSLLQDTQFMVSCITNGDADWLSLEERNRNAVKKLLPSVTDTERAVYLSGIMHGLRIAYNRLTVPEGTKVN